MKIGRIFWVVLALAWATLLILLLKVDRQPSPRYSLIVVDTYQQEWVVDYNLTFNDCESMKATPAAYCAKQPEKLK